jgi:DNA-directed RNA polymerase subunit beta'
VNVGLLNDFAVHLHTRIGVHAKSFNNPTFTEAQNNKILATSVGRVCK